MIAELLAAAEPEQLGGLAELAKLLGAGAASAVTIAAVAWQQLRADRARRDERARADLDARSQRQLELDTRLERMSVTLATIAERTALLVGHEPAGRSRRARTPAGGVPIAGPSSPRKPTSGE